MSIGIYQSAASLTALERWQDAVSQNITASQVTGFKKRTVEFSGVPMGEINTGSGPSADTQAGLLPKASFGISFQPGETYPTGRSLDIAIDGEGFFKVQTPSGGTAYTRAGELHLNTDRVLVSKDNQPILTDSGTPITLQPEGGDPTIAADGTVSQGTTQLGKIGVYTFPKNAPLTPIGGGLFDAGALQSTAVDKPQLLQGYLEGSNVTPLHEMVALVQIARAYEANQKIITSSDETLQRTLETLG